MAKRTKRELKFYDGEVKMKKNRNVNDFEAHAKKVLHGSNGDDDDNNSNAQHFRRSLPVPTFGIPDDQSFVTPLRSATVEPSNKPIGFAQLPDGVFFIKGEAGVDMFRRIIQENVDVKKDSVDLVTPNAPKKSAKRGQ